MNYDGWDVAKSAWGLLMTILGFMGVRQLARIDRLENERATREEVRERFETLQKAINGVREEAIRTREELREDMREHREESRETLGRIFARIDAHADRSGR